MTKRRSAPLPILFLLAVASIDRVASAAAVADDPWSSTWPPDQTAGVTSTRSWANLILWYFPLPHEDAISAGWPPGHSVFVSQEWPPTHASPVSPTWPSDHMYTPSSTWPPPIV